MSSNILAVFNPPPARDMDKSEYQDCLPCQIMSSFFAIGFGSYLASGKPFKYGEKERKAGMSLADFDKRNPKWWRGTMRGLGGSLVVLGVIRGTEGWMWNKDKQYKKILNNDD
ncbi:hypothetical protein TPHA_0F02860 [Tetrapisispora phaffii CBS 4417]|uniref:DUF4536 domain-containing protein n=1 Tax=Tetrapisispora phaffii (strain ATCC 24235 / CBS 4417 / NBRC 1672 / NRRL Y-8282 / UCD 70-5) TaxID=1071381 RepID=G8BUI1_TETPH|nr:hypothetical protein TPHA_0F02860 [Tetrapisispora phaffii CBS 4417]CCE63767.1 hypothetical protein TPHA_0F02860 [Tetrapisispora phaffii CBS 4417]